MNELEVKYKRGTRSPDLPTIKVDFEKVNPGRRLPKPEQLPLLGCSQDKDLYTKCTTHLEDKGCKERPKGCSTKFSVSGETCAYQMETGRHTSLGAPIRVWKERTSWCFGTAQGFATTMGVVPPPTEPVHGYVYAGGTGESTRYIIAAEVA